MNKTILGVAALLGMLAVILGAFGAHGLKKLIDADAIGTFETGVKYQMYHALLLLFVGGSSYLSNGAKMTIFYLVLIGVILFSGSIYGLATNNLSSFDFKKIGFVTPIGGLLLIIAWGMLIFNVLSIKTK
ncbi:Uncharacterized membrane protein YgdD, TMEM256/DUF423 family [Zhouia amylolytica]|uniref:Uncharacterized membrane protein YgdD, TMEM256/DUF423 family n=1 Tax=Zhouia amylolytica TaxID=376730 RepID=A0A1I6SLJ5_9FLAO|nr:DUF423 domain-containing protein [Zhouia amylolytica]MCQ0111577.1 DUF423 domain-containing protein [Zhouia amylolytica]SFS77740.1 Uncharacterized membrane protein YgdD, TMEM256/DUF423 family [Zhouia amylolytica]